MQKPMTCQPQYCLCQHCRFSSRLMDTSYLGRRLFNRMTEQMIPSSIGHKSILCCSTSVSAVVAVHWYNIHWLGDSTLMHLVFAIFRGVISFVCCFSEPWTKLRSEKRPNEKHENQRSTKHAKSTKQDANKQARKQCHFQHWLPKSFANTQKLFQRVGTLERLRHTQTTAGRWRQTQIQGRSQMVRKCY